MRNLTFALTLLLVAAAFAKGVGCAPTPQVKPAFTSAADALYTSSSEVRALVATPQGAVWAATSGGILHFDGRHWSKFTRRNGLPGNEWRSIQVVGGVTRATAMDGKVESYLGGQWVPETGKVVAAPVVTWRRLPVAAGVDGLRWGKRLVPPPPGAGPLLTAALPLPSSSLLVATFGNGLWKFDGRQWAVANYALPATAREITALAGDGQTLWVGTRRAGIFRRAGGAWSHFVQPDEPAYHNVQNLCVNDGALWVSTLDDGLVARAAGGWQQHQAPELSSNAPRQMTKFQGVLYARHGGGAVDSWDGRVWSKNVLWSPVKRGVYALAADDKRLYAAAWGGWSEWDGQTWSQHYQLPELRNVPLMGLLPEGDNLWIATQSHGLALWDRSLGTLKWYDERAGLPDDWVTCLAHSGNRTFAGTFVGGLAAFDGHEWRAYPELAGQNVTALEPGTEGKLWVATRQGLWLLDVHDKLTKISLPWLDSEVQALQIAGVGLWVGTRTSLNYVTAKTYASRPPRRRRNALLPPPTAEK